MGRHSDLGGSSVLVNRNKCLSGSSVFVGCAGSDIADHVLVDRDACFVERREPVLDGFSSDNVLFG